MTKNFSIANSGFYDSDDKASYDEHGTWPDDAIEVKPEDEARLRAAVSAGDTIAHTAGAWIITPRVLSAGEVAAAHNTPIKAQIAEIEAGQARAIRECLIGMPGASERLRAIDDSIAALRAQLVS